MLEQCERGFEIAADFVQLRFRQLDSSALGFEIDEHRHHVFGFTQEEIFENHGAVPFGELVPTWSQCSDQSSLQSRPD